MRAHNLHLRLQGRSLNAQNILPPSGVMARLISALAFNTAMRISAWAFWAAKWMQPHPVQDYARGVWWVHEEGVWLGAFASMIHGGSSKFMRSVQKTWANPFALLAY